MPIFSATTYDSARRPAPRAAPPRELPASLVDGPLGEHNRDALALLLDELRSLPPRHFWIALVPGASEQWGHHKAPPRAEEAKGVRISREFEARLARGVALLRADAVRFLLVSGGSVDASRPDYNEALRGREHLVARYAGTRGEAGELARRVLVDPLARHSTTNVRNADKLCVDVGIDRLLVATTMPPNALIWPAYVPVVHQTNQGWYFLHHGLSTFDWRCRRELGYALGEFEWFEAAGGGARAGASERERVAAIAHHGFPRERVRRDAYGA